eukprot:6750141-Alexandrium_andersonii.AAC.1
MDGTTRLYRGVGWTSYMRAPPNCQATPKLGSGPHWLDEVGLVTSLPRPQSAQSAKSLADLAP